MVAVTDVQLFANNRSATLNSDVAVPDGSIVLATGLGATWPSPAAGQFFALTLQNTITGAYEVCYCTARAGDLLTVQRAQEGTAAQAFVVASAVVQMRLTKGTLERLVQKHFTGADVGKYVRVDASGELVVTSSNLSVNRAAGAAWDSQAALTVPADPVVCYIERACTITSATIIGDAVGSCVVDVRKVSRSGLPAVGGNSICAAAKPTVVAGRSSRDTVLSGWTTPLAADDTLTFVLESVSIFSNVTVILNCLEVP